MLSDEQIDAIAVRFIVDGGVANGFDYARAIEWAVLENLHLVGYVCECFEDGESTLYLDPVAGSSPVYAHPLINTVILREKS